MSLRRVTLQFLGRICNLLFHLVSILKRVSLDSFMCHASGLGEKPTRKRRYTQDHLHRGVVVFCRALVLTNSYKQRAMKNHPRDEDQVSQAASLMGKRSWKARLKRYGVRKLKRKLSAAGKAAKNSGRPRLPDDQVTPIALYQMARRARLKAKGKPKERRD